MSSKIFGFSFLVFISIFFISFVSAYPIQIGVNSLNNSAMNTVVYHCTTSACTTLDILEGAFTSNYNLFSLPNRGAGTQYFAEYSYQTCRIPWMWRWDVSTATGNGPWNRTTNPANAANYIRNFTQRTDCNATTTMALSNPTINLSQSATITATVGSALRPHAFFGTVPASLRNDYSTNATVILYVDNVEVERRYASVVVAETANVAFTYNPATLGAKNIKVGTIFDQECKCSGYVQTNSTTLVLNVTNVSAPINGTNTILDVTNITCFDYVIAGHNQSCSVDVRANNTAVGNANVTIYYSNGNVFGSCLTNALSGGCEVSRQENVLGNYSVYANVNLAGYNPFNSTYPRFNYSVIAERYLIQNLTIYNNSAFTNVDYDFFRGETLYMQFSAYDTVTNQTVTGLQSRAYLVSGPGGRAEMINMSPSAANYRFFVAIPATHGFLGISQAFSFVFNFSNNTGGEAQVNLTIRNNLPIISLIPNQSVAKGSTTTLNLASYESDLEDSGSNLVWSVSGVDGSIINASISGKILTFGGVETGTDAITLTLTDLDGASVSQNIDIRVTNSGSTDEDDDDDSYTSGYSRARYNVTDLNANNNQLTLMGSGKSSHNSLFWIIILALAIAIGVLVILILLLL